MSIKPTKNAGGEYDNSRLGSRMSSLKFKPVWMLWKKFKRGIVIFGSDLYFQLIFKNVKRFISLRLTGGWSMDAEPLKIKAINTQAHFYNINTIRLCNRFWQWNTWNYNRKFSIIKHKHRRYLTVQVGSPIRPPIPSWLEWVS